MAWKATGQPTVRKQRDKWVVRVDGIDTSTGKHRPRQLGTFASQRSATAAARSFRAEETTIERGTVSWLVRRYVESRNDITVKAKEQYAWAIPHIEGGLGAIRLARLDREDVAAWIEGLAAGGRLSRRSVQICRNVLRAALNEAVDEGLLVRSPAARVGLPRSVAKPVCRWPSETAAGWPVRNDGHCGVWSTRREAFECGASWAVRTKIRSGARETESGPYAHLKWA